MTNESGRATFGRKLIAPLLAVALLAAGAHVWLNTNLFGPKELCGGLVTTDSAKAVFPTSGRVSDRDGLDDRLDDRLTFTCILEISSFLPGSDSEHLRILGSRERGDFPFTDNGRWPSPVRMSFFSGGATGAVGSDHGWILLPDACTTADGPAVVEGYVPEGSDPVTVTRFLTEVANKAAELANCATEQPLTAPDTLAAAPEPRQVKDDVVCGLKGLEFPGPSGDRSQAVESVQDRTDPTWSCEVSRYAAYTVTQESHLVAGIRSSPGFAKQGRVAGLQVSGFDSSHVVADCAGTPTYFAMELGPKYSSAIGKPGTPRIRDLFENFVDVAGRKFGCNDH